MNNNQKYYIYVAGFVLLIIIIILSWMAIRQDWFSNLNLNDQWETITNEQGDILFRYPQELGLEYINEVNWPPAASMAETPYSCNEGGTIQDESGEIQKILIQGREYCRTRILEISENPQIHYSYKIAVQESHILFLSFSVQEFSCNNQEESERLNCQKEESQIDEIVDRIFRESFKI